MKNKIKILSLLFVFACTKSQYFQSKYFENKSLDIQKYSGKWYEIARLPNKFEKKCIANITATYTINKNHTINVLNQCETLNGIIKAEGVAKPIDLNTGQLKVSFFRPFWGNYNVYYVDSEYKHAIVYGKTKNTMWILSRKPSVSEKELIKLLSIAKNANFDLDNLIFVKNY